MQKWEYKKTYSWREYTRPLVMGLPEGTAWETDMDLAQLGEQGWELVSAVAISDFPREAVAGFTSKILWVFKRPKT